jgi:hypothetical protein
MYVCTRRRRQDRNARQTDRHRQREGGGCWRILELRIVSAAEKTEVGERDGRLQEITGFYSSRSNAAPGAAATAAWFYQDEQCKKR